MGFRHMAAALGMFAFALGLAPPAEAGQGTGNPTLSVNPPSLGSGATTVTVTGRDYVVPPTAAGVSPGAGGVYLFFGYVEGSNWGPSTRTSTGTQGTFGNTYFYPGAGGSADTRGNGSGSTALVAFAASGETSNVMDRNGNWTASLAIPGPTFSSTLPSGQSRTFDCRTVTCGVFTIGAMGRTSQPNERFTPVRFGTAGPAGQPSVGQPPPAGPQQGFGSPLGFGAAPGFGPPGGFGPPQGFAAPPPPVFAPPPVYAPPPQAVAPPPPPVAPAVAAAIPAPAPPPVRSAETDTADDVLVAEAAPPGEKRTGLTDGALVASEFEDGAGSAGTLLLLVLAVAAGVGAALALIRFVGNGSLPRRARVAPTGEK